MSYQISEQLISYNRSGQHLSPQGFVIHSTDTPSASAQNEHDYFNGGDRQASAHYFADWSTIIRCIPENEVAWHAGSTANHKYLSVEMCEPINDENKFQETWNRVVWLVADACVRYNWNTNDNVWSHRGISGLYHETNHTDPIQYLAKHGKTWDELLQAIDAKILELKTPQPIPVPTPTPTPAPIVEPYVRPQPSNNITLLNGGVGWIETLEKRVIIHYDSQTYLSIEDGSIYAYAKGKDAVKLI